MYKIREKRMMKLFFIQHQVLSVKSCSFCIFSHNPVHSHPPVHFFSSYSLGVFMNVFQEWFFFFGLFSFLNNYRLTKSCKNSIVPPVVTSYITMTLYQSRKLTLLPSTDLVKISLIFLVFLCVHVCVCRSMQFHHLCGFI